MLTKKIILAATMAALLTTPAIAQSSMDHSAHAEGPMADYMATMDTMNGMESSGNADADFLLMMIPHHQSAIDMAKVELEQGKDQETQEMAEKIIAAQEEEIAEMKAMLKRLGVEAPQ
ncbi:DUF305 domain-containing protein [Falsirhodobacter sp. 20TX0035]|uniref:DUF305 domain-containing protein n=1 Tax=Falsirhodobacter sp. 20TX0035 TaxID=3022019 RepID=UPI00232C75F3|nr:DUF305 domain-containing protein [Falsirhodobacter sp. 20TX0035]MDB6454271.1 DUF305 domain-containing protein [Falsirhodobacter sp. 20TX0035]